MSSTDNHRKYFSPEDREETVFSSDKSQLNKEAICDDLDTSIRSETNRQIQGYIEVPQQPFSTERETPRSGNTRAEQPRSYTYGGHQQEESQNSAKTQPYSMAGRNNHINDVEQPIHESKYGMVEQTAGTEGEFRTDDRGVFVSSVKGSVSDTIKNDVRASEDTTTSVALQSTAERNSHINDVEQPIHESRYGTVERNIEETNVLGGAAGTAEITGTTRGFQADDREVFASSVKNSVSDTIKNDIKASEAAAFAGVTWDTLDKKEGLVKTAAGAIGREIEAAIGQSGKEGDITDRSKGHAIKYGFKIGKGAILSSAVVGRGAVRLGKYGKKLSNDVSAGALSADTAKKLILDRTKTNIAGAGKSLAGVIKTGAINTVVEFKGSDDLGIQAITKPKDIIVGTKRTLKTAKGTLKTTKKVAKVAQKGCKQIFTIGKKILTNPVVLKGLAIAILAGLIVSIIVSVISTVVGMFSAFSLKSDDYELSRTYLYITELDAKAAEDIVNEDKRLHIPGIDVYKYTVNGIEVKKDQINVCTNADLILTYLDSKFEDYTFDNVKDEITSLHSQLYQINKTRWTEEIEHETSSTNPDTGETETDTYTEYVYHMDIDLSATSWEEYYSLNKDSLLTPDQQEQYDTIQQVGVYSFHQSLSNPFVDQSWFIDFSSRWGWRLIDGNLKEYPSLDINMAAGTPINACNGGKVTITNGYNGLGNCLKIVMDNGDYTVYGHMSSISVSNGQTVSAGDVIGYVGSAGNGSKLSLEYWQKGKNLNPLISLGGVQYTYSGEGMGDEKFQQLMAEATKYIGYPYVWGGSSPSTSFDCSGFICWSYTHSGVYNLPRTTAQGVFDQCSPVAQTDLQPGDLVFFTGTYDSAGAVSHIGIYVGGQKMLHCGSPIGFADLTSSYWRNHFYAYGRLYSH